MGNRHQVYVISKIGSRYRTLATVHHQYVFGPDAIELLSNAVHLFQSPENRIGFEHEKRWATRLRESDWCIRKETNPFPFTLTCLFMGYSFKEEDGYSTSSCHPQTFNQEFDKADNNERITVLDITDIDKIRYCFVNIHCKSNRRAWEIVNDFGVPSMVPLSATEYLKSYGHEQEQFKEAWKEWIHHLSKLDLIDTGALNSVWPRNTWKLRVGAEIVPLSDSGQEPINVALPVFSPPLTLRKACMEKFLKEVFNCPIKELPAKFERATLLSDFRPALKSAIFSTPTILTSSAAARYIFSQLLESEKSIDLGPFDLSPDHIIEVLEQPRKAGVLKILSLCGNQKINDASLVKLIDDFPRLQSLYLLDTPQIPLATKIKILRGQSLREFFDTDLYALPFAYREKFYNDRSSRNYNSGPIRARRPKLGPENEEASRTIDISKEPQSFMNDMSRFCHLLENGMPPFCGLSYISPVIEQMIYITCGKTDKNSIRDSEGGLDIINLFQRPSTHSGISDPGYHAMSFKEANRRPSLLLQSLARFIAISFRKRHIWLSELRMTLAMILAMEPNDGPGYKVLPLCAGLFSDDMGVGISKKNGIFQITREIIPNEWTFVMIAEEESYKLIEKEKARTDTRSLTRYAFLSAERSPASSASGDILSTLIVADVKQFLESNFSKHGQEWREGFLEWWDDQVVNCWKYPLKFCGRKEIESVVKSIKFTPVAEHSNAAYEIGLGRDKRFINCMEKNIDRN
ncbi:uncharacterized protein EAE97_006105 [Botrytis byssoidea]|uniref:Uncharacterized protein n=1 Tax=Botrytis byssoidea TaxID=139641 RepID=A0A9P5IKT9_9HELO|nr:uncharacterized protein EAE97_006105 [Botrytis byssoidea]KAF7942651.1 hypothetical protein EAE97_006105 [Botrytis byssoidea]